MIPGSDMQWGTPWHNCAVLRKNGDWELIRKNMALVRGYELKETEDGLPYFVEGDKKIEAKIEFEEEEKGNTRVYIGDMLPEVTETDIREFCTQGNITKIEIVCPKKWHLMHAFLTFEASQDAIWTVENLNGASLCGGVVRVEFPRKGNKE
eukprot:TRINITY_DN3632_c0_g1_i3.p1 TRINITY_DN3632_c0_g1~~TRINITY_DN3632_c0_g1_i3.p1  ORF type:complete len:151 (-),score=22.33 TRINITY_DN3632_c0_g1_i3:10-462(-)